MNDDRTINVRELLDALDQRECKHLVEALDKRVDVRFDGEEKRVNQRFGDLALAVNKAEIAQDRRLEGMNEFRAQLDRQAGSFVTRDVHSATLERVSKLERWPWVIGGVLALLQLVVAVWLKFA